MSLDGEDGFYSGVWVASALLAKEIKESLHVHFAVFGLAQFFYET